MNIKDRQMHQLAADFERILALYHNRGLEEVVRLGKPTLMNAREEKEWRIFGKMLLIIISALIELRHRNQAIEWIEYAEQALASLSAKDVHRAYLSVARAYINDFEGNTDSIIYHYRQAIELLEASSSNADIYLLSESLTKMGTYYMEQSNAQEAFLYLQKSITLPLPDEGKQSFNKFLAYSNLARYYVLKEAFDKGIAYQKKYLHFVLAHYPPTNLKVIVAYIRTGAIYMVKASKTKDKEAYQSAINSLEQVLALNNEKTPPPYIASTCQNLGYIYLEQGMYHKALHFLEKALETYRSHYGEKHTSMGVVLNNIGNTYICLKEPEKAKQSFQNALHCLYPTPVKLNHDYHLQPPMKGSKNVFQTLKALKGKADAFYASFLEQTQDSKELAFAVQTYAYALQLFDSIRTGFDLTESKFSLSRKIGYIRLYEYAIKSALKAEELGLSIEGKTGGEWAFEFCEKSKATVLMNAMQDSWAKANTHLPEKLLQKEKTLQSKLTYLDKSIQKLQLKAEKTELQEEDKQQLHTSQAQFFDAHQAYKNLKKQLEADYPEYHQLKHNIQTVDVSTLQSILEDHQIVLNYFVGKTELFIFVVTPDDFIVMQEDKPEDFEALVEQFLQSIKHHELKQYKEAAARLYVLLLKSVEDYFIDFMDFEDYETTLKHLLIIPDDILTYIPFEALLRTVTPYAFQSNSSSNDLTSTTSNTLSNSPSSLNPYANLDYLLNHAAVSYHYSANLLYLLHQRKSNADSSTSMTENDNRESFAGFAPVYKNKNAIGEAAKITHLENPSVAFNNNNNNKDLPSSTSIPDNLAWATRSEAIRSDGSFAPLPYSEKEVKNIADLFTAKKLASKIYLHESATKEHFEAASSGYRYLLVAAHGLVNDEQTVLSGLVFYDGEREVRGRKQEVGYGKMEVGSEKTDARSKKQEVENEKREVGGEKQDMGSEKKEVSEVVESSPASNGFGDTWNDGKENKKQDINNPASHFPPLTSSKDSILSMEETYQLNLSKTDLVVLSSCDSGIGRLVKGEGMMALNRGFIFAGASNVISTLFKVYDKPSSFLTQYLFEAILGGENYTFALRTAKMRLLQQEKTVVKSWSGFVLFGK